MSYDRLKDDAIQFAKNEDNNWQVAANAVVEAVPPETRARLVSQAERDALKRKYDQPENGIPMHVPSTLEGQVGGTHYLDMLIQPWEVIDACNLDFYVGTAVAYLMRWQAKGGLEDVKKAIHTLQHFVETEEAKCSSPS